MVSINKNPQNLTTLQHEVLTGSLLGDAYLGIKQDSINPSLRIQRQLIDLPYLQWQFEIFRNCCREKAIRIGKNFDKRYNKWREFCNLESRYIPAFEPYHTEWYGSGKKRIPKDIELTKLIIAVWVCDDANIYIQKSKIQRLGIRFHTQGFLKEDVEILQKLLNDRYNVIFTIQRAKKNMDHRVIIPNIIRFPISEKISYLTELVSLSPSDNEFFHLCKMHFPELWENYQKLAVLL
jgi:hypothetical protein